MELKLIFESTFLIGLTFVGIVIPIFTLSISLLGHAVERAEEKINQSRKEAEEALKKEREILEAKLNESKTRDIITESKKIEEELRKLTQSREKFEKESAKIINRYNTLKFKKSVLIPGFYFLCAIVFSLLAKIYILPRIAILIWFLSLLYLIMGIHRIYKSLSVIQEIGLSSDKYQQEKMYEAIYRALETHAEAEKPELGIFFKNPERPFKFPKASEIEINFRVFLLNGKIAKGTKILFLISKEFDFLGLKNKWNQPDTHSIPNALTGRFEIGDVRRGINSPGRLTIKTPDQAGSYKMGYTLSSEEFRKREIFDIEIV